MRAPSPAASDRTTFSDGSYVVVGPIATSNYTDNRPPQRNDVNKSSKELARGGAQSSGRPIVPVLHWAGCTIGVGGTSEPSCPHPRPDQDDQHGGIAEEYDPDYPMDHTPPSNLTDDTAETPVAGETERSTATITGATPRPPAPSSSGLREEDMRLHHHIMAHGYHNISRSRTWNIDWWMDDAGISRLHHYGESHTLSPVHTSMHPGSPPMSYAPSSSAAGQDLRSLSDVMMPDAMLACAGSWFDEDRFHRVSSTLSISTTPFEHGDGEPEEF